MPRERVTFEGNLTSYYKNKNKKREPYTGSRHISEHPSVESYEYIDRPASLRGHVVRLKAGRFFSFPKTNTRKFRTVKDFDKASRRIRITNTGE